MLTVCNKRCDQAWGCRRPCQRIAFWALFGVILFGMVRGSAQAVPILDQENLPDESLGGQAIGCFNDSNGDPDPGCTSFNFQDAQTFTVGLTGRLVWIDVPVRQNPLQANTEAVTLEIRPVIGGVPASNDGAVLGSVTLPSTAFAGVNVFDPATWPRFDVSGLGISVKAGDVLAYLVRTSDTVAYLYNPENPGNYPRGEAFRRNRAVSVTWEASTDFLFRTFVDPSAPAPALSGPALAAAVLILLGVGCFAIGRKRKFVD